MQRLQSSALSLRPISRTREPAGMRPFTPEVISMSLADRHAGMSSRIKFLRLMNINTSASARKPD
eukprot:7216649-Pyramimonas_sp.AAC.1